MRKTIKFSLLCFFSSFLVGCSTNFRPHEITTPVDQSSPKTSSSQPESNASTSGDDSNEFTGEITLTLDPDGGTVEQTVFTLEYGKPFQLPAPTKLGYIFNGWEHNGVQVTDSSGKSLAPLSIARDATLTANYSVRNITLNFYHLGEKLASKPYNIEMDLSSTLEEELNSLTYPVQGWYRDEAMTRSVKSYEDLEIDSNGEANLYSRKAEGFTLEGTTLLQIDQEIVFGDVDLTTLFTGGSRITRIGIGAFLNHQELTSIIIPDSVTEMQSSVFNQCSNLKFARLPNGLKEINTSLFGNCSSLESIEIPDGVETIGLTAFENCTSLVDVKLPNNLKQIKASAFSGCSFTSIELPEKVTKIDRDAFSGCANLRSIRIPNSVVEIGQGAFSGCTALKEVTLSQNLSAVRHNAFYGCSSLTEIAIPSSVKVMETWIFKNCFNLKIHVDLPRPADGKVPEGWADSWNPDNLEVTWRE